MDALTIDQTIGRAEGVLGRFELASGSVTHAELEALREPLSTALALLDAEHLRVQSEAPGDAAARVADIRLRRERVCALWELQDYYARDARAREARENLPRLFEEIGKRIEQAMQSAAEAMDAADGIDALVSQCHAAHCDIGELPTPPASAADLPARIAALGAALAPVDRLRRLTRAARMLAPLTGSAAC